MRRKVTVETLKQFMDELAASARSPVDPEPEGVFEEIARLKNELDLNVELASPDDFIPAPSDWREKSPLIASVGKVQYFHYDLTLQALAKLERNHEQDVDDVRSLVRGGYVTAEDLTRKFARIEPELLRYLAIDARDFRKKVEDFLKGIGK